jgi:hypothetical protein
MTTQPFLVAPFKYGPLLGNEQTPFRVRKIKYITDLVGFQIHPVYLVGELPSQAQSHSGWNYSKARTPRAGSGSYDTSARAFQLLLQNPECNAWE